MTWLLHELYVLSVDITFYGSFKGFSLFLRRLIFKCSCETMFKKKQLLFEHFHQNADKRVTCVFKCPECNSVFPQKQLLMQHFKVSNYCIFYKEIFCMFTHYIQTSYTFIHVLGLPIWNLKLSLTKQMARSYSFPLFTSKSTFSVLQDVHIGNMTAETERRSKQTDNTDRHQDALSVQQQKSRSPVKHTENPRKKAEQDSRPRVKPTGWTCGECLKWFPERESYVSHVKTNHGKVRDHEFPKMKRECVPSKRWCSCTLKLFFSWLTYTSVYEMGCLPLLQLQLSQTTRSHSYLSRFHYRYLTLQYFIMLISAHIYLFQFKYNTDINVVDWSW